MLITVTCHHYYLYVNIIKCYIAVTYHHYYLYVNIIKCYTTVTYRYYNLYVNNCYLSPLLSLY